MRMKEGLRKNSNVCHCMLCRQISIEVSLVHAIRMKVIKECYERVNGVPLVIALTSSRVIESSASAVA